MKNISIIMLLYGTNDANNVILNIIKPASNSLFGANCWLYRLVIIPLQIQSVYGN
jgi:hypothetical protein